MRLTSMISSVCSPTDTAAYNEYEVSLYSCIIAGLVDLKTALIVGILEKGSPADWLSYSRKKILCLLCDGRKSF